MKGQLDYEDQKKFINLVKQHPTLYDPSAKTHHQSTANDWANITAEMNIPTMQVADWKSKWKCLRDTFVKKKKDTRLADSQVAADKATQWRYFEHLSFLDQFVDKSRIKTVPRSNGSDYQHYTIVKGDEYGDGESGEDEGAEANYAYGKHPAADSGGPSQAKKKRRTVPNQALDMDDDEDMLDDEDEEDEDGDDDSQQPWNVEGGNSRSFFMSCAFRMDRLPERVQSYLQLQVSQLFFNAENPEVSPVPIMSLPPREPSVRPKPS